MLFVDGENFTIRGQDFADATGLELAEGRYWRPHTYLWLPNWDRPRFDGAYPDQPTTEPVRAYYYTSAVAAEDTLTDFRQRIWALGFTPQVFKKERRTGRTKGVDISLATDMLRGAYTGTYETAVLVAGDGDYVPLVEEVKRQGRRVVVAFYGRNHGLNEELRLAADEYRDLEHLTERKWKHYAMHLRKDGDIETLAILDERTTPADARTSNQVESEPDAEPGTPG